MIGTNSRRGRPFRLAMFATLWAFLVVSPADAQNDDPQRPAAISTEEVPVIPREVLDRLAQYQSLRGAAFYGWSPEGNGILIRTRFGNSSQLHRTYTPGGRREQITFFDEPVRGWFVPKSSGGELLLSMSRGGSENDQLYLLDPQSHRVTLLTDGKSRNRLGAVMQDGSRMIVSSNRRNGRDTDLYVAACRRPGSMTEILRTDRQFWYAADWSQDGKTLLLGRYVSINESYPALLDVQSRALTDIRLPGDEKAAIGGMAFSPDARTVYIATDAQGQFRRLARLDLATNKYTWLTEDIPWDVSEMVVEPTSGLLAFTVNEDGASRLYLLQDGRRRPLTLPLGIVVGLEFSPDGNDLGFTLARPDAPADAYSIRIKDSRLTRWTYSEAGGLDPESFVLPSRIHYRSFDDRQIPAFYYRPRHASAEDKVPVLISIHGGPESQYRPYFSGAMQYYVNELGIAVIAPNVRGSNGYGKTYLKLDNGPSREDSVRDIGALLDWIAEQDELDPTRVAVVGGSYGGYMVLATLVHYGERIRAGIDVVGIANFITFLENTSPYRQDLRRAEYGDERDPKMRAFFERINPTANTDKIRSALLVAHGKNDPRVPFSEAEQIAAKVRARGRPVWTVYAENEGHGFAKKNNRDYLRAVEVMFLKQHLQLK